MTRAKLLGLLRDGLRAIGWLAPCYAVVVCAVALVYACSLGSLGRGVGESAVNTLADRIERKLDELDVAGSTDGGDRLTLPSGEGGGESLDSRQDLVIPPSAPPFYTEEWFIGFVASLFFASTTAWQKRKQSLANRALEEVASEIESRKGTAAITDIVGNLKAWRASGNPAARVLHAAVKRATK